MREYAPRLAQRLRTSIHVLQEVEPDALACLTKVRGKGLQGAGFAPQVRPEIQHGQPLVVLHRARCTLACAVRLNCALAPMGDLLLTPSAVHAVGARTIVDRYARQQPTIARMCVCVFF